jgi:hypothetical protein
MVKNTGKAMAEQMHKVAEEVSGHASKNIFNCSKTLQKMFSLYHSIHQVWKQKH